MVEVDNKKKRSQVNALYCPEEIAEAVNNHPWFSGCTIGSEKAAKLLEALNFANQYAGEESQLGQVQKLQDEIASLKADLEASQNKVNELTAQLSDDDQETQRSLKEKDDTIADKDREIARLQDAVEMLTNTDRMVTWEKIRKGIDPAYASVLEEITNRLVKRYNLPSLEPHAVLITFFMKYYYNQEWEFAGMPFVMKQSEILAIVQREYPDMTHDTLKKALQVK